MLKYAAIFLIVSIIAGATGMTGVSAVTRRISLTLFALFMLGFLLLAGFALLVDRAVSVP